MWDGVVDQYFLGNQSMGEMSGSEEGLAFGAGVSQVAFLVVVDGLGTVFPEGGRHFSACCVSFERLMLPGR